MQKSPEAHGPTNFIACSRANNALDGEHSNGTETYFPGYLEAKVREVKHQSAREIFEAIKAHLLGFAERNDDISFVIIKRT